MAIYKRKEYIFINTNNILRIITNDSIIIKITSLKTKSTKQYCNTKM